MDFTQILLLISNGILLGIIGFLLYSRYQQKTKNELIENEKAKLGEKVNLLELENIESRLNPHLLKNILNSIQSHAYQTYFAMEKLSSILDYILYESKKKYVTPQEEIAFALDLIEINKIKTSPLFEIKVKQKLDENEPLLNQNILAPLITIDLIENAFKHADLQSPDSFITVVFEFRDSTFYLTVSNKMSPKPPLKKDAAGFGIESLIKRLNMIYGSNFKLDRFIEDDVYIAHLKINLLDHKAKMLAARR